MHMQLSQLFVKNKMHKINILTRHVALSQPGAYQLLKHTQTTQMYTQAAL